MGTLAVMDGKWRVMQWAEEGQEMIRKDVLMDQGVAKMDGGKN